MYCKKIMCIFAIFIYVFSFLNFVCAADFVVSNYPKLAHVGKVIELNIKGENVIGKIGITSSNENVVAISKSYEWLDGNVNVKLSCKSKGEAFVTIKSIDTSNSKDGSEVNITKKIKIIVIDGGDINNDGNLDVSDAYIMLSSIANNKKIEKKDVSKYDINSDGNIDVTDAYLLLSLVANN